MTNYLIEKGTNYSYLVDALKSPTFESIRRLSVNFINQLPEAVKTALWEELNNGVEVLENESQLSMYVYAYGKMHAAKLVTAFDNLDFEQLTDIHIIDWGCGQGMATLDYFEYIREKQLKSNVKSITLVEPSELALKRAALHARKLFPQADIRTVKKFFDDLSFEDIRIEKNQTILHFFSNVLDVECFSIEKLAKLLMQNQSFNWLVCVSPVINAERNQRLYDFIECFPSANIISDYINSQWHCGWTIDYKVVEVNHKSKKSVIANINEKHIQAIINEDLDETVTDIDGNVYKAVRIGNQIWMAENLRVSRYRNGDLIPNVTEDDDWRNFKNGAWCNYDNNPFYDIEYGKLYNWYAVDDNRGLAPEGWHVPSEEEWDKLINHLGGYGIAGKKMRDSSVNEWSNNESGFSGLAAGNRNGSVGTFQQFGSSLDWWSSIPSDTTTAKGRDMFSYGSDVHWFESFKSVGVPVRCVKDEIKPNIEEKDKEFEIVCKNNLCGFRNSKGEMITPFKYESVSEFCGGMAMVSINSKYGYINRSGEEIIPLIYDLPESWIDWVVPKDYFNFRDGLVRVKKDGKYGFLDINGNTIIPIIYDSASLFCENIVVVSKNYKYGFINTKGDTIIPLIYENAHSFCEGLAAVNLNDKWGYIDKNGDIIIPLIYNDANKFSEGLAAVIINEKYGFIDNAGRMVIPNIYYNCYNSSDNFEYDESIYSLYHFNNGVCLVCSDFHKFILIDMRGEFIQNVSVGIYQN